MCPFAFRLNNHISVAIVMKLGSGFAQGVPLHANMHSQIQCYNSLLSKVDFVLVKLLPCLLHSVMTNGCCWCIKTMGNWCHSHVDHALIAPSFCSAASHLVEKTTGVWRANRNVILIKTENSLGYLVRSFHLISQLL